jgi:purine-nucleoside phosphorylase
LLLDCIYYIQYFLYVLSPSYEEVQEIAKILKERTKHQPLLGIVCGSGLGGLGDLVEEADVVPYSEIPNFPVSTG